MQRLPVLRLVGQSYRDVVDNWRGLLRVGGVWLFAPWLIGLLGAAVPLLGALGSLLMTIGVAAVAVAWHRHILLHEALDAPMAPVGMRVGWYLIFTIALGLLILLPILLLGGAAGLVGGEGEPGAAGAAGLLLPVALLAGLWVVARLQLVFPAVAIDERSMNFARAWATTSGNGLRLLGGLLLIAFPVLAATIMLTLLLAGIAEATGSFILRALADLASVAAGWLQAPLVASFLSYAWLFLVPRDTRPVPA